MHTIMSHDCRSGRIKGKATSWSDTMNEAAARCLSRFVLLWPKILLVNPIKKVPIVRIYLPAGN